MSPRKPTRYGGPCEDNCPFYQRCRVYPIACRDFFDFVVYGTDVSITLPGWLIRQRMKAGTARVQRLPIRKFYNLIFNTTEQFNVNDQTAKRPLSLPQLVDTLKYRWRRGSEVFRQPHHGEGLACGEGISSCH